MKIFLYIILTLLLCLKAFSQNSYEDHYLAKSNNHFIINYTALDTSDIDYLMQRLEKAYLEGIKVLKIKKELKPIHVWLDSDFGYFMKVNEITDSNTWVMGGAASIDTIRIMSPLSNHMLIKRKETYEYGVKCLVHEVIHCLCYFYNNDLGEKNCWLSEGVAIYLSHQNDYANKKAMMKISGGTIKQLADLDSEENFTLIYGVGYSLIEFIAGKWGFNAVISLLKNLGDIPGTLGISEKKFRRQWTAFVKLKYL